MRFVATIGALALVVGCKASVQQGTLFNQPAGDGGGAPSDGGNGSGTGAKNGGDTVGFGTGIGGSPALCDSEPEDDKDGDGFKAKDECNDCDPNVNPSAVDIIAEEVDGQPTPAPVDEDCDGVADNPPPSCDDDLAVDDTDAFNAAKAVGLCKRALSASDWGLVAARWAMPDGSDAPDSPDFHLGHGLLSAFGENVAVQEGARMLALSSGTARQPSDPGFQSPNGFDKDFTAGHPQGFPKESPACPGVTTGQPHDAAALEVTVRAPSNAHGFSFYFDFYTFEWPGFVCSQYNDFFVALLSPVPEGQADGNISFDSKLNPVSVNNAFVDVCGCFEGSPCQAGGKAFACALGTDELLGTGFGTDADFGQAHAATSWLITQAPVEPGQEFTLRWAVYDSGDGVLDSTTLIDNWQWTADSGTTVGTAPVPK